MNVRVIFVGAALSCILAEQSAQSAPAEQTRSFSLNLGLDLTRSWSENYYKSGTTEGQSKSRRDNLSIMESLLFLGTHVHYGPTAFYYRYYSGDFQGTDVGLGGTVKFTLDDLQKTSGTPFVSLTALMSQGKSGSTSETTGKSLVGAIGYEYFFNRFVSLQNYVSWEKNWSETDSETTDFSGNKVDIEEKASDQQVSLNVGLGIYL